MRELLTMRDEGEKDARCRSGYVGRIKQLGIRRKLVEELDDEERQHGLVLNQLSTTTQPAKPSKTTYTK